ncbi:MAG: DMT family transporter [Cyanobacteria bacterium]|nr:DMT family transporter [Cyanobacteriota bacterium]MDW8200569.1 DMT family transporter [Cyanobacteriota bacterium SKYGB_h_bin112]
MTRFLGEIAALTAACLWAIATVGYQRAGKTIPPLLLNLLKGVIAIALLLFTLILQAKPLPLAEWLSLGLLLLSGVVGIGLGDTFLFYAINSLGVRRTLLLGTLAPGLSALLGLITLQESLRFQSWLGIGLTIAGVAWVIAERTDDSAIVSNRSLQPTALQVGILYGLLATLGQAIGAVLSRAALAETTIDPLWSSLLRLVAGEIALVAWWLATDPWLTPGLQLKTDIHAQPQIVIKIDGAVLRVIVFSAFCGTYLGIWLQQTAIKHTAVGIAQALSSTSPLFVLPIVAWLGEPISLRAVVGVLIAITGIVLLFSS